MSINNRRLYDLRIEGNIRCRQKANVYIQPCEC